MKFLSLQGLALQVLRDMMVEREVAKGGKKNLAVKSHSTPQ